MQFDLTDFKQINISMKVLRSVLGLAFLIVVLFSLGANFTSCKKDVIRDTIIIKDTIRIKDTVRIVDSSTCSCYNLTESYTAKTVAV